MSELDQNKLAQLEQSVSVEQIQLSEKLGAIKATAFIKKLVTVTEIKLLAEIKETKQYKGLKLLDGSGKLVTVTTFEEFCQHIGMSREKVDQDILNLSTFGEDFLETSQRMGLGYRDLRKLRKLPDAEREILINGEAVKTEDRESLIDLIEEMAAKHAKEKAEQNARITELLENDKAKDQLLQKKDQKINELDAKNTKLSSPLEIKKREETKDQQLAAIALSDANTACQIMHNDVVRFTNSINSILDVVNENGLYHIQEQIEASIVFAFQQIAQTSVELGIQIDFEAMVNPEWQLPASQELDQDELQQLQQAAQQSLEQ
ncbi:hypothetical protein [Acinetobacter baumannii]|uniref:hypothetical protein n=1 Tax=Acinetobacter baumannii TaxID=470 RepID=UPI0001F8ADFE|nr:hypothetical protein [Acinetobacter baumannii]ADX03002.1 Putative uncharacterized protein [Acinetobacter baumannii 1656-2]AOP63357.1 hypothetical protein DU202_02194 [Acinetobacter baumannii DU202]RQL52007.1 hypothetical protein BJI61_00210 [Acinetobacter baumannii]RSP41880.1 hypothetical protein EA733_06295 [Acinetobacter baumannii]